MKKNKGLGTRLVLGVGILTALLTVSFLGQRAVTKTHREISQLLSQAAEQTLTGELSQAQAVAEVALQQWEKSRRWTAVLADQTPMDDADRLFAQLQVFGREKMQAEYAACCLQLAALIRSIADAHVPYWWNVL